MSEKIFKKEENFTQRSKVIYNKNNEGKIVSYFFEIKTKNAPNISGNFAKEEMNMIYRLYSYYGSNITQREISRFFPEYSLLDFKKILKAFNITKACSQFAPHMFEDYTTEELQIIANREKENNFLKTLESEKQKNLEKLVKELYSKNIFLKSQLSNVSNIFENIKFDNIVPFIPEKNNIKSNKVLMLNIADLHIGAEVSPFALYENTYNTKEVIERLKFVINDLVDSNIFYDEIIINLLGDQLDGMNQQTARGGNLLPQNLDNKGQIHSYIEIMSWFIGSIHKLNLCNNVKIYSVDGGNHDAIAGYVATMALFHYLNALYPTCETVLFNKSFGHYNVGIHTFILFHGKNWKSQKYGFPLTIDHKTENFINDYISENKLHGPINFIKGDLHTPATTYGKKVRYRSCLSAFGASEYCMDNYGNSVPGVSYDIIEKDKNKILSGEIPFLK